MKLGAKTAYAAALGLACTMGGGPASAQMGSPGSGTYQGLSGAPAIGGKVPDANPAFGRPGQPPPTALPGAQSKDNAALPSVPPVTMEPTEALFDAINRGDMAAARDAISRGADVSGHNILGLTPIQLSIDLGRNDITFLLLANGAGGGGTATAAKPANPAALLTAGTAQGKQAKQPVHKAQVAAKGSRKLAPAATPELPQLYAGNGGTPIPSAGFLGFDAR